MRESKDLAIIVVAYNRPHSLSRILYSLESAMYPDDNIIDLIISIDNSGNEFCYNVAKSFNWVRGIKKIIKHEKKLGLRNHIISCGDFSLQYDGVIILEDDCFVSKDFYDFSIKANSFYRNNPKIAGISLYSYVLYEKAGLPFLPLKQDSDVFFMQVPSSLGQIWTKEQWSSFKEYYKSGPLISNSDDLPLNVINWPESSWKKYFYKFMVDKDLYFVYPYLSKTTNFSDAGTHTTNMSSKWQVPLSTCIHQNYRFVTLDNSKVIYDSHFELLPHSFIKLGYNTDFEFSVDLYGTKRKGSISTEYIFTTKEIEDAKFYYGTDLVPIENNILYNTIGNEIKLVKVNDEYFEMDNAGVERFFIGYNYPVYLKSFGIGVKEVQSSKTYKIGSKIRSLLKKLKFG